MPNISPVTAQLYSMAFKLLAEGSFSRERIAESDPSLANSRIASRLCILISPESFNTNIHCIALIKQAKDFLQSLDIVFGKAAPLQPNQIKPAKKARSPFTRPKGITSLSTPDMPPITACSPIRIN